MAPEIGAHAAPSVEVSDSYELAPLARTVSVADAPAQIERDCGCSVLIRPPARPTSAARTPVPLYKYRRPSAVSSEFRGDAAEQRH